MLRVIGKRLALLVPTLLGLSVLLFAWVRALPGGPATALLGDKATPEAVARINEVYGFDRPLLEQYVVYTGQLLRGDFGASIVTGRPVVEEFLTRFPATLELSLVALVFAVGEFVAVWRRAGVVALILRLAGFSAVAWLVVAGL